MKTKNLIQLARVFSISCVCAVLLACSSASTDSSVESRKTQASNLLVEGNSEPPNIHSKTPRLSWHANVISQSAYQIQVATSEALLKSNKPDLWDSGKVAERRSINIAYKGKPPASSDVAFWRVKVWQDGESQAQAWSDIDSWQMGLLEQSDWQANWIQAAQPYIADTSAPVNDWMRFAADIHPNSNSQLTQQKRDLQTRVLEQLKVQPGATLFRYSFAIDGDKKLVDARLHSTAAGYYEIFLNGDKVDDRLMDPGQTDYDKRILYNTDTVTNMLQQGNNTIAVHLGSGWYSEEIAFSRWSNPDASPKDRPSRSLAYGQPKFIAQLELEFDDGSRQIVSSNEDWLSHASPILKEGLFSGELYDARAEVTHWHSKLDDANLGDWRAVEVLEQWPTQRLEPQLLEPIKAIKKLVPVELLNPEPQVWVLDFGQNFTGVPTIDFTKLPLTNGQSVHLRYAEWIDKAGNISQKSGGGAPLLKQVDTYIAKGDEVMRDNPTWTPIFTWHGFRYLEIRGLTKAPALDAITAHLVRSAVETAGKFESSDDLLNRIHHMALWGYESNLMAVPMDCPIRERAGWTGDAHAAMITGNYNYNMDNFWHKYLGDFKTATFVAPAVVPGKRTHGGNFDWAAAEVMIAWEHYRHHGDVQLFENQYESMQEYMSAGEENLENSLIRKGYGDWCDPVKTPGTPRVNGRCSPQHTTSTFTSSILFAHSANLMAKISRIINKPEQAEYYAALFNQIRSQINTELFDAQNASYNSQTANAMAIMFDVAPDDKRALVAKSINDDVLQQWDGHASVGALGQSYLYTALSDYGYEDTAFNIFKAEGYPGYRYLFEELNATTLWERKGYYDPKKDPDGTNAPTFSLNHPFHAGYDGWFYEGLGGIRPLPDSVGFQDFALKPQFVSGLDEVTVSYTTGYGEIKSRWTRSGEEVTWYFTVPNNTTALVTLPSGSSLYTAGDYTVVISDKSE
ncbi:family 78 glycoside hydrolase catalytic domain [Ningiella sp. W23]|uniref:family 78 glycoside hydrolase catalytic domain n=1 Tax=Ningiella sp. W23 TaxID=3023715 RepID=UPI0037576737